MIMPESDLQWQDVHSPSRKEVPPGTFVPLLNVHMAAVWSTINIIDKEEN